MAHGSLGERERVREREEPSSDGPLASGFDTVDLSDAGLLALAYAALEDESGEHGGVAPLGETEGAEGEFDSELTPEERAIVREMQARDAEVRAHEQAHAAAAGSLAQGGPSYEFERGPDGRNYAVAGEVRISLGGGSTPEERLSNAERARRAANAPANPSSADRAVAAKATQMAAEARAEIQEQRRAEDAEEASERAPGSAPSSPDAAAAAAGETDHARESSGSSAVGEGAAASVHASMVQPDTTGGDGAAQAFSERASTYASVANGTPVADLLGTLFA